MEYTESNESILNNSETNHKNDEEAYDSESFSTDSEIPADELYKLLEDPIEEQIHTRKRKSEDPLADDEKEGEGKYEVSDRVVLIEKGTNHFEVLPEGWIEVSHNSGMPLYLHKASRVCTLSRPYFLGPGSVRKHEIPVTSIPCLSYRRAIDREKNETEKAAEATVKEDEKSGNDPLITCNARIETVKESVAAHSLNAEQFRQYCSSIFQFKTMRIRKFKSWAERRKYTKKRKHERQMQRPQLPDGTKLITFPIDSGGISENGNPKGGTKREWIMNPSGKSYICILHEYLQHALKMQPTYKFSELENAATPYAATVYINEMEYGVGYGTSKKQAKSEAARLTLEVLIPEMKSKISIDAKTTSNTSRDQDQDLSFFDEIRIEDPRVAEFCAKTTEPSPHDVLLTCLQRNFGLRAGENGAEVAQTPKVHYQGNAASGKRNEFTMTVGRHTVTVQCQNKREGKQRAAQAILQAMHPHLKCWGSLLRLYGNRSVKSFKVKKQEEQEITLLQSKAAVNSPNHAILDKLRLELGKLQEKRKNQALNNSHNGEQVKLSSTSLKNVDL